MKQQIFAGWIIITLISGKCFAAGPMEERISQFTAAMHISTDSQTNILSSSHFVFTKQPLKVGDFQLKQKEKKESSPIAFIDVDILDTNDYVVATGRIFERSSSEMARKALLEKLVLNSMMIESLVQKYEVAHNDIGDLCIVEKSFDKTARAYSSVPLAIHFVRGCTAVSIYPMAKFNNIHDISKVLDRALTGGAGEPQSGK